MFKCTKCDYADSKFFGLCPSCGDGIGEESNLPALKGRDKKASVEIQPYKIDKADDSVLEDQVVKRTQFKSLNSVLSTNGGFVKDQVIALGAQPGVGKSTLCAQISDDKTLYISTEESINQIKSRFKRVNPGSMASIASVTDLETILHILRTTDMEFVVIDSLNNINDGAEGYVKQANNLNKITSVLKLVGKPAIIISQVTKSGGITGMNTILHTVDTVSYMDKSEVSDHVILSTIKNRFGAVGSVAIFDHKDDGLSEASEIQIEDFEDTTGITISKARFGYKSIDVVIEALVSPTNSNFGLRRSYGLNLARVQQIIGVLASNSGIDFSSKDIYVSVSNGLSINDTSTDLAIANSILSSHYRVESLYKSITGSLGLNGSVRNSKDVSHIRDMISKYKRRAKY